MRQHLLPELGRLAVLDLTPRALLERACNEVRRSLRASRVAVLLTEDAPVLQLAGYAGKPAAEWTVGTEIHPPPSALAELLETGMATAELLPASLRDPDARRHLTPIPSTDRTTGLLLVDLPRRAPEPEPDLLTTITDQLGGALAAARRAEELEQHAALMEILSQVSRTALEASDLDDLLQRVVEYITQRQSVAVASILLLDESGRFFVEEVNAGQFDLHQPAEEWPVTVGVCGRCVRTGEPQLVLDPRSDPDYFPGHPEVRSEYIVPIRFRGEVLGVLNLESTRSDSFTPYACRVFDRLADQVAGAIRLARVNRQLEEANRALQRLSALDGLTGVSNRRRFDETITGEWGHAARFNAPVSLLLVDIDAFKALNDQRGHLHGDDCLRRIAAMLDAAGLRSGGHVARYGGDEFAVLLPRTTGDEAVAMAERLRESVAGARLAHGGSPISPWVTVSIGVATGWAATSTEESLVAAADEALYEAKRAGRNRVASRRLPGSGPRPASD